MKILGSRVWAAILSASVLHNSVQATSGVSRHDTLATPVLTASWSQAEHVLTQQGVDTFLVNIQPTGKLQESSLAGQSEINQWHKRFESRMLGWNANRDSNAPLLLTPWVALIIPPSGDSIYFNAADGVTYKQSELMALWESIDHTGANNQYADIKLAAVRAAGFLGKGQVLGALDGGFSDLYGNTGIVEFANTAIVPVGNPILSPGTHGTQVASIMAADCNGLGTAGVACAASELVIGSLSGDEGILDEGQVDWAEYFDFINRNYNQKGKRVIAVNNSYGNNISYEDWCGPLDFPTCDVLFFGATAFEEAPALIPVSDTTINVVAQGNASLTDYLVKIVSQEGDHGEHDHEESSHSSQESMKLRAKDTPMVLLQSPAPQPASQYTGIDLTELRNINKFYGQDQNGTGPLPYHINQSASKSTLSVLNFDYLHENECVLSVYENEPTSCNYFENSNTKRAWAPSSSWAAGQNMEITVVANSHYMMTASESNDEAVYYEQFGGTSGAAPQISGAIALLAEMQPDNTAEQLRDRILWGATPASESKCLAVDWEMTAVFLQDSTFGVGPTNPRVVNCDDDSVSIKTTRLPNDDYTLQDALDYYGWVPDSYPPPFYEYEVKGLVNQKKTVTAQYYDYPAITKEVNDYVGHGFANIERSAMPIGEPSLPYPSTMPRCQSTGSVSTEGQAVCSERLASVAIHPGQLGDMLAAGDDIAVFRDALDGAFGVTVSTFVKNSAKKPEQVMLSLEDNREVPLLGAYGASIDYKASLVKKQRVKRTSPRFVLDHLALNASLSDNSAVFTAWKLPFERLISIGEMPVYTPYAQKLVLGLAPFSEGLSMGMLGNIGPHNAVAVQAVVYGTHDRWNASGLQKQAGGLITLSPKSWNVSALLGYNQESESLLNAYGSNAFRFPAAKTLHAGVSSQRRIDRLELSALVDMGSVLAAEHKEGLVRGNTALRTSEWYVNVGVDLSEQSKLNIQFHQPLNVRSGSVYMALPGYRHGFTSSALDRRLQFNSASLSATASMPVDIDMQLATWASVGSYKLHLASGVRAGVYWFETNSQSEARRSLYTRVSVSPK